MQLTAALRRSLLILSALTLWAGAACASVGKHIASDTTVAPGDTLLIPLHGRFCSVEVTAATHTHSLKDEATRWSIILLDNAGRDIANAQLSLSGDNLSTEESSRKICANFNGGERSISDDITHNTGLITAEIRTIPDNMVELSVGNSQYTSVGLAPVSQPIAAIAITSPTELRVCDIFLKTEPADSPEEIPALSPDEITYRLSASTDPLEGKYEYLDSDTDTSVCRRGGDYSIALLSDGNGGYIIYYLSGAENNAGLWHTGRSKGHIAASPIPGQYDLTWLDSEGLGGFEGAYAGFSPVPPALVLQLNFPKEHTIMRFYKADK